MYKYSVATFTFFVLCYSWSSYRGGHSEVLFSGPRCTIFLLTAAMQINDIPQLSYTCVLNLSSYYNMHVKIRTVHGYKHL